MPLSLANYLSDGVQRDFAIPFSYIKKGYVGAYGSELDAKGRVVGDRVPLSFSWINDGLIRLDEAQPAGNRVTIERETYAEKPLVDFQDAALISEEDLDLSTLQTLHVAQEARDRNAYEIVQVAHDVAVAAEVVKEYAERTEDAASDAESILQECEDHLAVVEAARAEARTSRDRAEAAASGSEAYATQAATDRVTVERLAAEVATNAETTRDNTQIATDSAADVAMWFPQIQANTAAAEDAARRAQAAAEAAELAGGVDTSAFARKDDMELALGTKADVEATAASFEEVFLELVERAPLASPALTGTPTAPTPAAADTSTRVATTEFVKAQGYASQAVATASADGLMSAADKAKLDTLSSGGGAYVGDIRLWPFSANELPAGWHFCNGGGFSTSSAAGLALAALSATFKSDWGITVSGSTIYLPNLFSGTDGYFLRPVNGSSRLPGNKQTDAIRDIVAAIPSWGTNVSAATATGAFSGSAFNTNGSAAAAPAGVAKLTALRFSAADSGVPTATENRPMNIGMTPAIYLGV